MKFFSMTALCGAVIVFFSMVFLVALAHHKSPESLKARVAAVGTLNIGGAGAGTATSDVNFADDEDGETIYSTSCAACHASGVAGAPVLGDVDDWDERIEQGINSLVEHAIAGFTGSYGVMPPKGGDASLSDNEVTAAVQFMVDQVE